MNWLRNAAVWLDDRLHLTALYASTAGHEVPASAGSWFYVFGSATLLCFVIQIITGRVSGVRLYPVDKRSLDEPAISESRAVLGLVSARCAQLGIEFHGLHHDAAHDSSVPVRRL